MTDKLDEGSVLFVSFNIETKIVRFLNNLLIPSKIVIKADINPDEDATDGQLTLALKKIRFWFENIVSDCIVINADNDIAFDMLIDDEGNNRTSNLIMTTPAEPTDEILAAVFQAKMASLASGIIDFTMIDIKSDNQMGLAFTFLGDGLDMLPEIDDWIGPRRYFESPWWERNDASTLDVIPPPDADINDKPSWAFSLDTIFQPKATENIIVRPDFKPKVIDGGKKKK